MKLKNYSTGRMRMAIWCVLAALLPLMNSCKKESADVSDLLSSVPSSAGMVAGINLKSLLEKSGCKVEGSSITPGKELSEWISTQEEFEGANGDAVKMFFSGESGIDPMGAILFSDAYDAYVTAMIADTPKFMEFVEKNSSSKFEEIDGVKVCGNVAIVGAQTWVSIGSSSSIDSKAVKNYSNLESGQSFKTNPYAGNVSMLSHDLTAWVQTSQLTRKAGSFADATLMTMVSGMLFEDASAFALNLDFEKGKAVLEGVLLNEKGQPAKYLLPADKIDVDEVKSLGTSCEALAAISVKKDMVKKIEKMAQSVGLGPLDFLKSLDGTLAVASGDMDFINSLNAVVTTDGNPSSELMNLLGTLAPTRKDGKLICMSKGTLDGDLSVEKAAEYFKGATFGVVINTDTPEVKMGQQGIKELAITFNPESKSIKIIGTIVSVDPSENFLLTILKKNK